MVCRYHGCTAVAEVIALFKNAIRQDPDGSRTSPPKSISVAKALIERGGPFDAIPDLAMAGFTATARQLGPDTVNDVTGATEHGLTFLRNAWYLMGYVPSSVSDDSLMPAMLCLKLL